MAEAARTITVALCTSVVSFDGLESNPRTIETAASTQMRRICDEAGSQYGCEVLCCDHWWERRGASARGPAQNNLEKRWDGVFIGVLLMGMLGLSKGFSWGNGGATVYTAT
ncbi:hypothetical protein BC829DRAFT_415300 [Chytridium lagenaria]|nr:hypothetical protein BC829DRAFT_415300 [Chytridium lagenaria]